MPVGAEIMPENGIIEQPAAKVDTQPARSPRFHHGRKAALNAYHRAHDATNQIERVTAMRDLGRARVPKLQSELAALLGPDVVAEKTLATEAIEPMTTREVVEIFFPSKAAKLDTQPASPSTVRALGRLFGLRATVLFLEAACAGGQASPTPTTIVQESPSGIPSASTSVKITPSPIASPTEVSSPSPFEKDGNVYWATKSGEVKVAQDFDGLKAQLIDGKIEYIDAKGVKEAEFKPNLMMGDEQTGVTVARADVITKLTKKAHDAGQFKTALPFALNEIDNSQIITMKENSGLPQAPALEIVLPQPANIVEFNPYNEGVNIIVQDKTIVQFELLDHKNYLLPANKIESGYELNYMRLYSKDATLDKTEDVELLDPIPVGTVLAKVSEGKTYFGCFTTSLVNKTMTFDNIITENGIPLAVLPLAA